MDGGWWWWWIVDGWSGSAEAEAERHTAARERHMQARLVVGGSGKAGQSEESC